MQRIAIARAIFSERPVLLLDEATSALDEQTEAKVLDNLRKMTDKTVIIVTHRPAALEITDKIITFKPNED
jgi:ATP-binding cassette subfamily B protein